MKTFTHPIAQALGLESMPDLSFLSVCSGIEAASVAWEPLGWKPVGFSEVEPFPCSLLKQHYPRVRNYGDMTKWREWDVPAFDVLCGGTPCQGFSVAGRRGGMDDPRSQLAWDFHGIAAKHRPRWLLWENVPGVLSSWSDETPADSRELGERGWQTSDFDAFLCALADIGYGLAWGVMDAQYFGLAQRRNRVFVVGYLGDWRRAAAVLLDRTCLSGDPAPRREKGKGAAAGLTASSGGCSQKDCPEGRVVAGTLPARTGAGGGLGTDLDLDDGLVAHEIAGALRGGSEGQGGSGITEDAGLDAHTLRGEGFDAMEDGTGRGTPLVPDIAWTLQERDHKGADSDTKDGHLIPVAFKSRIARNGRSAPSEIVPGRSHTLPAKPNAPVRFAGMAVRRLTPTECERLMGFPDDYTLVKHRGNLAADGPRYKALGNSWAVTNVRHIGERIAMVEALCANGTKGR